MFSQLLINSIIAGSIYTLIALSFSLIYSTTKFFHFPHGAVYTFCPYFAYLFTVILGMPLVISIPSFLIFVITFAVLTYLFLDRLSIVIIGGAGNLKGLFLCL